VPATDWLKALTVVTIFGVNFVAGKVGVTAFPPLFLMVLRFALVLILTAPWARWPDRRDTKPLITAALLLGCGHFGCLFTGLQGLNASVAALLIQLQVPMASLLSGWTGGDRLSGRGWLGMAVAIGGVALLGGDPSLRGDPVHFSLVLVAALCWAAAQLVLRKLGHLSAQSKNAAVAAFALPVLGASSYLTETDQLQALTRAPATGWAAVAYMAAASSVVAYGLWYGLIHRHPVNRVVPLTLLVPLIAVLSAVVLLGDPLTTELMAGGAAIVVGVAIVMLAGMRPTPKRRAGGQLRLPR